MTTPAALDVFAEPVRPVNLRFQLLLALANAGAIVTLLPVLTVLIPAQTTAVDPRTPASSLALVLALGALGALVGNPLAGALSDRTTARLGRRRPWLLIGMLGVTGGLVILAHSASVAALALGWSMAQFFGNMLLSGYGAVVPDHVPAAQRGTTLAIIGLASPVAIILSDLLFTTVTDLRAAYYPIIAVNVLLTGLFVLRYREPALPAGAQAPLRLRAFLGSFWISPRRSPGFARVWLMWLLVWTGYNLATGGFFFLYLQNVIRFESLFPGQHMKDAAALIQLLQIGVGVPLMLVSGILSDRIRSRKIFVITGAALMLAGLLLMTAFHTWPVVLAASVTVGAGFWIFYSLGVALITQMLPSASDRGKDLGVINVASTLPQIIMPPLGAAIINTLGLTHPAGYLLLFGAGAAAVAGALLLMRGLPRR